MPYDERVDDYIAEAAAFAQGILMHVRALIHEALPEAEEGIKWSMPHFMVGGKNIVAMAAFKAHAAVVIHHEKRRGDAMGSMGRLLTIDDLPPHEELIARIRAAPGVVGAPRPKRAPKPELPVPPAFSAALDAAPQARAAFDAFAPSHRREYIEWISEAKREDTAAKRIAQAVEWLAEGKKRNWKYEKC